MTDTLLKCTTRHIRLFTAKIDKNDLIFSEKHLTLDLDPDNEFIWTDKAIKTIQSSFKELVAKNSGKELSDYTLRKIGSELEDEIRLLLQSGELSYNPECRVLNYSMGLPKTPTSL